MSVNSTNPTNLFGGTWEQLKDKFLLGCGDTYSNGSTGGEANHTLTVNEIASHEHKVIERNNVRTGSMEDFALYVKQNGKSGTGNKYYQLTATDMEISYMYSHYEGLNAKATGGGQSHNNMPPYLAVYMWKRTA